MSKEKLTKSVHLEDGIHTELKAYADFRGMFVWRAAGFSLRKSLDEIEKESERGENANMDNSG